MPTEERILRWGATILATVGVVGVACLLPGLAGWLAEWLFLLTVGAAVGLALWGHRFDEERIQRDRDHWAAKRWATKCCKACPCPTCREEGKDG